MSDVERPQGRPEGGKETILFVEDDAGVRVITERILRRGGYDILVAHDGQHALKIAAAHEGPIAMLLTDINMPELSGEDLSTALRAQRPGIQVVYISGYNADAVDTAEPGVHFLGKPYLPNELLNKVREVLDG